MGINLNTKKSRLHLKSLAICVFVGVLLALFFWFGGLETWEWRLEDNLFLGAEPRDDIVIVAIDDDSLQEIGRWPWPREKTAELVRLVGQARPKVLGIDVNFPEPADGDEFLIQSLAQDFSVVLPQEAVLEIPSRFRQSGPLYAHETLAPIKEISQIVELGLANTPPDSDGIVRRIPVKVVDQAGRMIQSFGSKIADLAQGEKIILATDDFERLVINYVGAPKTFNYISARDLFASDFESSELENKIVLVGATAPDLHDVWFTPTAKSEPMPGIEVQANLIQTILNQDFLNQVPAAVTILLIFAFCLGLGTVVPRLRARWSVILFAAVFILYILTAVIVFDAGYSLNILYPSLALALCFVFLAVYRYAYEEGEKRQVRRAFEFYLSPRVIEEILKDPKKLALGGEEKNITIMFSDIRGFTSLSEGLDPGGLTRLLNEYLTQMTEIVLSEDGVLDKYIGDAVMAFWGAPLVEPMHAVVAAKSALRMIGKLNEFNREKKWPSGREIKIGIGLNTGPVIVGNMGAEKRFDYTAIGDAVNLASRTESLNKQYGTQILITKFTKAELGHEFITRLLDRVAVKGKKQGVEIYELVCLAPNLAPKQKEVIELYEDAFAFYQKKKWDKALDILKKLTRLTQDDLAVKNLIARCEFYKKQPPAKDWDGTWVMKTK
ncbi:adenylate/guanylate cyclase domain-containing protein [Patescibacteria group bacterium]|nr:adenylate/guanylate cyclase domain-containing protein [Patescibacteria group bacterium]MBU1922418.1 adenylate/guanylate cyclase domain-containing protein [Patescibacteria group bacterium]